MKNRFVAIHDYGAGSVGIAIFARSKSEIAAVLPPPDWIVYEPGEKHHLLHVDRLLESDIDDQSQLLRNYIMISQMQGQGKESFPVRDEIGEERYVWARSRKEIEDNYPSLEFRYLVPFESTGYSDIDNPDKFLLRNRKIDL